MIEDNNMIDNAESREAEAAKQAESLRLKQERFAAKQQKYNQLIQMPFDEKIKFVLNWAKQLKQDVDTAQQYYADRNDYITKYMGNADDSINQKRKRLWEQIEQINNNALSVYNTYEDLLNYQPKTFDEIVRNQFDTKNKKRNNYKKRYLEIQGSDEHQEEISTLTTQMNEKIALMRKASTDAERTSIGKEIELLNTQISELSLLDEGVIDQLRRSKTGKSISEKQSIDTQIAAVKRELADVKQRIINDWVNDVIGTIRSLEADVISHSNVGVGQIGKLERFFRLTKDYENITGDRYGYQKTAQGIPSNNYVLNYFKSMTKEKAISQIQEQIAKLDSEERDLQQAYMSATRMPILFGNSLANTNGSLKKNVQDIFTLQQGGYSIEKAKSMAKYIYNKLDTVKDALN